MDGEIWRGDVNMEKEEMQKRSVTEHLRDEETKKGGRQKGKQPGKDQVSSQGGTMDGKMRDEYEEEGGRQMNK